MAESWKPGHLYLSNKRLCWWYDFEGKVGFEIPLDRIVGSTVQTRNLRPTPKNSKVLDLIYHNDLGKQVASFAGDELGQWEKALNRIVLQPGLASTREVDTCPQCGQEAPVRQLLEKGCDYCGWVSPRLKSQLRQSALDGAAR
jgi:hypothetical protein